MSRLLEFILGSILIAVFTVAFLFFFAVRYVLRAGEGADCAWYASARAWIDSNADGQFSPDEPPLSNVQIHLDPVQDRSLDLSWPVFTDRDGDVQLSVSLPGCADTAFEIYVEIPEGYRATTKPRVQVIPNIGESTMSKRVFYFGFVPER